MRYDSCIFYGGADALLTEEAVMQDYLEYQARVMERWCRLYLRTQEEFIRHCAAKFRRRHAEMLR